MHRVSLEPVCHRLNVKGEILDPALDELHPVTAKFCCHLRLVLARKCQHIVIHIDTDHTAFRTNELCRHVADLSAAAAKVEDDITRVDKTRRVSATIIL